MYECMKDNHNVLDSVILKQHATILTSISFVGSFLFSIHFTRISFRVKTLYVRHWFLYCYDDSKKINVISSNETRNFEKIISAFVFDDIILLVSRKIDLVRAEKVIKLLDMLYNLLIFGQSYIM